MTAAWTEDRVRTLTRLWGAGLSARDIARRLGGDLSRCAVIGKAHRLGLAAEHPRRPRRTRTDPARPAPPRAAPEAAGARRVRARRPPPVRSPAAGADARGGPPAGLASVLSAGPRDCRWPYGDPRTEGFALCGRPIARGAYCAAHAARAYRAGDGTSRTAELLRLAGLG